MAAATSRQADFRVIIVGGGIAGLTLANALQHAGVDFLLLESRGQIAPALGASIGVAPNGNRILDQLGCFDEIERLIEPVESSGNHKASSRFVGSRSDMFKLGHVRMNYPVCFLERQALLRILSGHLVAQDKVLLNKRVQAVEHADDGVTVRCADGSSYRGDIVAGADGVSSIVRREMWRAANTAEPGVISNSDRTCMMAEYKCLFGISSPTAGLTAGNLDVTYTEGVSTMVIAGKGGVVFWFLFGRLPRVYKSDEIPRFSPAEAEEFARQNLTMPITSDGTVKFSHVWKNRKASTLLALEEADYAAWTWGRFVGLGDSVHKMTPNTGEGGNSAIESAAALANAINALLSTRDHHVNSPPSRREISDALKGYQQSRKPRASHSIRGTHALTRIHALKGWKEHLAALFMMQFAGDGLADHITDGWIGATMLDYLPPPPRSLLGTMPFNPSQGAGKHESLRRRALVAAPLLGLGVCCFALLVSLLPRDQFPGILKSGVIDFGDGRTVPVLKQLTHISFVDTILETSALVEVPSALGIDPASSHQMFTFFVDTGAVYALMLIEGSRRANRFKPASLPFIFGLLATHGIGVFFPLYYFLYYILTPISTFAALDKRLTSRRYTLSVLPAMAVGYYLPLFVTYCASDLDLRYKGIWIWHLFPFAVTLIQHLPAWLSFSDTVLWDRLQNPRRDMSAIRLVTSTFIILSATVWIYTLCSAYAAGYSLSAVFLPSVDRATTATLLGGIHNLLIWDQISFVASSLGWILYLYWDLWHAGMMPYNLGLVAAGLVLLNVVGGTGAATVAAWWWREEILASRRHKDAVLGLQKKKEE